MSNLLGIYGYNRLHIMAGVIFTIFLRTKHFYDLSNYTTLCNEYHKICLASEQNASRQFVACTVQSAWVLISRNLHRIDER